MKTFAAENEYKKSKNSQLPFENQDNAELAQVSNTDYKDQIVFNKK